MLPRSAKAKGKRLENYVARELAKVDKYAYRRADSGSGRLRKEDVFTTLPFFIECKNQDTLELNSWWKQTLNGCPTNKLPILIYKRNFEREPTVVTTFFYLLTYISGVEELPEDNELQFLISFKFNDFVKLLWTKKQSE